MFAKFNLLLVKDNLTWNEDYYEIGLGIYTKQKQRVSSTLDNYLSYDGSFDGSKIESDWFPQINANVFLSHSHQDEKAVICLAGFLYHTYGITSFIDSTVWGYADKLLKQIDDRYCVQTKKTSGGYIYDYNKRNHSTSHVHLMLQGALAKMINRCECLIFVNTPNSLNTKDIGKEDSTSSPWIYSELLMATTFPARNPDDYGILKSYSSVHFEHCDLNIKYKVNLADLQDITLDEIEMAATKVGSQRAREVLNQLYLDKKLIIPDTEGK